MKCNKFKAGDSVYYPDQLGSGVIDTSIFVVTDVKKDSVWIKNKNNSYITSNLTGLFHVTPENKAALEQLYGMEFEAI